MTNSDHEFLKGKDSTKNIVNISVKDNIYHIFQEVDGEVSCTEIPAEYYLLYQNECKYGLRALNGNLHYKYAEVFTDRQAQRAAYMKAERNGEDTLQIYNPVQALQIRKGYTYFGGMSPSDVSVLSFDIETSGLTHGEDSFVYLISNTLRIKGKTVRKLFKYDDFETNEEMIDVWARWVRKYDPSILLGHNIMGFDLPYLQFCSGRSGLRLGRDTSLARFGRNPRQFRKDGSQSYSYHDVTIFGRELIDTFFLSIKYDIQRNYESYGLKAVVAAEGLEVDGRQHYDAGSIRDMYKIPEEWAKICAYAEHDADDSLALFDLMIPSYFYYTQFIPRQFQQVINTATGSQVNAFMMRSYLQEGHSIPKASEVTHYQGAISYGNPGLYKFVNKVDVASLYPSIIRQYEIYSPRKDPKKYFLRMVSAFTEERLKNKALARDTGDRRYKDLEQSQKLVINSAYGFMGAPGLNFNAPECAAKVTTYGREILETGIKWAEGRDFKIVNVDTDSFSYTSGKMIDAAEFAVQISGLNELFPELIRWEDDGQYAKVLVVKAKNYVLYNKGSIKIKGSALKATMKEPAMKEFIGLVITKLLHGRKDELYRLYHMYIDSIHDLDMRSSIYEWCSKRTVTKAVLSPERTNEARVKEAAERVGKKLIEGDKLYVFFKEKDQLALRESYDGVVYKPKLYEKVYKTMKIFETILDIGVFPNYALKRNQEILNETI